MRGKKKQTQQFTGNLELPITFHEIVDSVEDVLLVIGSDLRIIFANSAACRTFNQTSESLIGNYCYQALHGRSTPCNAPLWTCPLDDVLKRGGTSSNIHSSTVDVIDIYFKITAYPIHDEHGNIKAIVEMRRDVTAERELETQIMRRHHQLLALSHISNAVSELWDLDTVLRIALDNVLDYRWNYWRNSSPG